MFVSVEVVGFKPDGAPDFVHRPVCPSLCWVRARPDAPEELAELAEARLERVPGTDRLAWYWHHWSLAGTYTIRDDKWHTVAELSGDDYRWRKADGSPFIPYVVYHAALTGQLLDPYEWKELVEGTLNSAVYWTLFGHVVRNASWPQRFVYGATIAGEKPTDGETYGNRTEVVVDPAVVLRLIPDGDASQFVASQWASSTDPSVLHEAISQYDARIIARAGGISPSDAQKISDRRSGIALAISQEGRKESQRRFAPIFQRADSELLRMSALVSNAILETDYAEDGYSVKYSLPELDNSSYKRDEIAWRLDRGLVTKVKAYAEINGITEAQAADEIATTEDAAKAPLNGAQAAAVLEIVSAVALGTMPRDAGVQLAAAVLGSGTAQAELVVGSAGKGFKPSQVSEDTR